MCVIGPNPIFALYSNDERPRKTVGAGYDMEKSMYGFGLGVFPDGLDSWLFTKKETLRFFFCLCFFGFLCVGFWFLVWIQNRVSMVVVKQVSFCIW